MSLTEHAHFRTANVADVSFVVDGVPVPWKRARAQGKRRFSDPDMIRWRRAIQLRALEALSVRGATQLREAGLYWSCLIQVVVPPRARADCDNHIKGAGDAVQGVFLSNDLRIVEWHARIVRAPSNHRLDFCAVGRVGAPDRQWTPADMTDLLGGAW